MIVDLDPLPAKTAVALIRMCVKNNIDTPRSIQLLAAMSITPVPDIKWELDVPEKYLTFFLLSQK